MWWNNRRDKEKEDDRARTLMYLSLLSHNPYLESLEAIKREREDEKREVLLLRSHHDNICSTVLMLNKSGSISNEEYAKWLLDETGTYIPKLKE